MESQVPVAKTDHVHTCISFWF